MAENTYFPNLEMTVEEFESGLIRISKLITKDPLLQFDEVIKYFNHYALDGRIVQVSNTNCVNVVECVEDFLRTGKIRLAKTSRVQEIEKLEKIYRGSFRSYTIPSLKNVMKNGERGIIYGIKRNKNDVNHVFNVIKKDNELVFIDAQVFSGKADLRAGYESFKYLKTK